MKIKKNIGLSNSETVNDVQKIYDTIYKEIKKVENAYQEYFDKLRGLNAQYTQELLEKNPYALAIAKLQDEQSALNADIDHYKNFHEKKLAIDKWYIEESKKINSNNNLSQQEKSDALFSLNALYDQRSSLVDQEIWQERTEKIVSVFGDGFADILKEYGNFDGNMRKMAQNLYDFLVDEAMNALITQILSVEKLKSLVSVFSSASSSKLGFWGKAGGIIKGIASVWTGAKFHSGGIVPASANSELPGTAEQLALLKGGERVLSPAENSSYNSDSQSSPVVFNNFNIKAWDSKDVQKYLLENKQLLNAITYEGIKDNRNHLRTIVRNA